MKLIKLIYDNENNDYYLDYFNPDDNMGILGVFLTIDVKCQTSFRKYFFDESCNIIGGNITYLEKEDEDVIIHDMYPDEEGKYPKKIQIPNIEFVKILDTWLDVVCKTKPKEVIIKYENGEFVIETKD